MTTTKKILLAASLLGVLTFSACGGSDGADSVTTDAGTQGADTSADTTEAYIADDLPEAD